MYIFHVTPISPEQKKKKKKKFIKKNKIQIYGHIFIVLFYSQHFRITTMILLLFDIFHVARICNFFFSFFLFLLKDSFCTFAMEGTNMLSQMTKRYRYITKRNVTTSNIKQSAMGLLWFRIQMYVCYWIWRFLWFKLHYILKKMQMNMLFESMLHKTTLSD